MNLPVLVLRAHNIYVSTHIYILWCDIKKITYLTETFYQNIGSHAGHLQQVSVLLHMCWLCDCSHSMAEAYTCVVAAERSLQMEQCLPAGSLNSLEPAQWLTNRDQIMVTPWCCLHIPPFLADTSAVQQQLMTNARWRQVLVLDPLVTRIPVTVDGLKYLNGKFLQHLHHLDPTRGEYPWRRCCQDNRKSGMKIIQLKS